MRHFRDVDLAASAEGNEREGHVFHDACHRVRIVHVERVGVHHARHLLAAEEADDHVTDNHGHTNDFRKLGTHLPTARPSNEKIDPPCTLR